MKLRSDGWYDADKGKHFVLTEKGKAECVSYEHKTVGEPIDEYDTEAVSWAVNKGYVIETSIPGWTTLKGYEVVYYNDGHRLYAGNPQVFPTEKLAEVYRNHYKSYPWVKQELFIENVEYEGVPLSEGQYYNGKELIDKEHYFGLDAHEVGSYFTEDMICDFMDMLPPASMSSICSQIGEPVSSRIDENGKCRATFATFKKITENVWEYCGDCFRGETEQRGMEISIA